MSVCPRCGRFTEPGSPPCGCPQQIGLFGEQRRGANRPGMPLGNPFGRDVSPAAATPEDVESRQAALRPSAPFQAHSDTSAEAAERIEPALDTERGRVLCYLRGCGEDGATDEETQTALDMNPSTERPRRIELLQAGFLEDSGERRKTEAGRRAVVWTVTEKGA